jgi:hypothetical protein
MLFISDQKNNISVSQEEMSRRQGTVIVNEPRAFSYGQTNARGKEAMKGSWKIDLVAASRRVPQGLEVEHKIY